MGSLGPFPTGLSAGGWWASIGVGTNACLMFITVSLGGNTVHLASPDTERSNAESAPVKDLLPQRQDQRCSSTSPTYGSRLCGARTRHDLRQIEHQQSAFPNSPERGVNVVTLPEQCVNSQGT
jgi:hypothetical protein